MPHVCSHAAAAPVNSSQFVLDLSALHSGTVTLSPANDIAQAFQYSQNVNIVKEGRLYLEIISFQNIKFYA